MPNPQDDCLSKEPSCPEAVIDLSYLQSIVGNDSATMYRLLCTVLNDTAEDLQRLQAAMNADDASGIEHAAHRFKAKSITVGASQLAEHLQQLEKCSRHQKPAELMANLAAIEAEFAVVTKQLEAVCQSLRS